MASISPAPEVACLMMQKNEGELLRVWVAYHCRLFGAGNLFVYDNGSSDPYTLEVLRELEVSGVNLDRSLTEPRHFHSKGWVFASKIKEIEARAGHGFDFFMPLDCDEFVAAHTNSGMSFAPEAIFEALDSVRDARGVLKIAYSWLNAPGVTDRFFERKEIKCFFATGTIGGLDAGFHGGVSRHDAPSQSTAITHIHLHRKPFRRMVELTQDKLTGLVDDWSVEGLDRYVAHNQTGTHLPKYLKMTESEYAQSTAAQKEFDSGEFEAALREVGVGPPFASRDTTGICSSRGALGARACDGDDDDL